MKKIIIFGMILIFAIILSGCINIIQTPSNASNQSLDNQNITIQKISENLNQNLQNISKSLEEIEKTLE